VDKFEDAPALPTPPPTRLFDVCMLGAPPNVWEEDACRPHFQAFPNHLPTLQNRFSNQDEDLNNEGYNSKEGLPHFTDEEDDDIEGYSKLHIGGNAPAPSSTSTGGGSGQTDSGVGDASCHEGLEG